MQSYDVSVHLADVALEPKVASAIWQLLLDADQSFVPPLSARHSSTQSALSTATPGEVREPRQYFEALQKQHFILARPVNEGSAVAGFMSFRTGYTLPAGRSAPQYHYVTTVIVRPASRGQGLTTRMYRRLMAVAKATGNGVATRTWSTNAHHIGLLSKLGFSVAHRVPNDRGVGVDTVYFVKDSYNEMR